MSRSRSRSQLKTFQIRQEKNIKVLKKRFYQPLMSSMTDIGWVDANLDPLSPLTLKQHSTSRRKGLSEKFFEHDFRPFYKHFESAKSKSELDTLQELRDSIIPQPMETFKYFRKMFAPLLFICFAFQEDLDKEFSNSMVTSSYNRYNRLRKKEDLDIDEYFSNLLQTQIFLMDLLEFVLKRNEQKLLVTLFSKISDHHSITKLKKKHFVRLFFMHKQIDLLIVYLGFAQTKMAGEAFKQQFIELICTVINNLPDSKLKFEIAQKILNAFEFNFEIVYENLLLPDNENLLLEIGEIADIYPQIEHYDKLIHSGLYSVALALPVSLLADALFSKQNFKVLMSNLKEGNRIDGIATLLHYILPEFTNYERFESLVITLKEILKSDITDHPLLLSVNLLKTSMVLSKTVHHLAHEFKRFSQEAIGVADSYMRLCNELLKKIPYASSKFLLTEKDDRGNCFFDYYFKDGRADVEDRIVIEKVIDAFWDTKIYYEKNFDADSSFKQLMDIRFNFKSFPSSLTVNSGEGIYHRYKFHLFESKTKYYVINNIISFLIALAMEIIYCLYYDPLFEPLVPPTLSAGETPPAPRSVDLGQPIYSAMTEKNLGLFVVVYMTRISMLINVVSMFAERKKFWNLLLIVLITFALIEPFVFTVGEYISNRTIMLNLNLPLMLLLFAYIVGFFLAFKGLGKHLTILFSNMIGIISIFFLVVLFNFIGIFFIVNRFRSMAGIHDPYLESFYAIILFYFELMFGAFVRYRDKIAESQFQYPGDIMIVLVSFFANVMMIAFLTAYLMEYFNQLSTQATYNILSNQFYRIKEYQLLKNPGVLYMPIWLNYPALILWPIFKRRSQILFTKYMQKVAFLFFIMPIVVFNFFFFKFFKIWVYYFKKIKQLFKLLQSNFGFIDLGLFITWLVIGPLVLLFLSFWDFVNLINVIFNEKLPPSEVQAANELTKDTEIENLTRFNKISRKFDKIGAIQIQNNYVTFNEFVEKISDVDKKKQTLLKHGRSRDRSTGEFGFNFGENMAQRLQKLAFRLFVERFAVIDPENDKRYIKIDFLFKFIDLNFTLKNFNLIKHYYGEPIRQSIYVSVLNDKRKLVQKLIEEVNNLIEDVDTKIDKHINKKVPEKEKRSTLYNLPGN